MNIYSSIYIHIERVEIKEKKKRNGTKELKEKVEAKAHKILPVLRYSVTSLQFPLTHRHMFTFVHIYNQ